MTNALANKLKDADPKAILIRYLSDETTEQIAKDYGVTRQALGQFLYKTAEAEWKEAQVARAIARKDSAEDALNAERERINAVEYDNGDQAKGEAALSLARTRALELALKSAQWDLERVCRRIYGQDQPPSSSVPIQINIGIARSQQTEEKPVESVGDISLQVHNP